MSCSVPSTTTVLLIGQMHRGGLLKIDEKGGLGMTDKSPNNLNPCKNITKLTLKKYVFTVTTTARFEPSTCSHIS